MKRNVKKATKEKGTANAAALKKNGKHTKEKSTLPGRGSWKALFYCAVLFISIYITASFYTSLTGSVGRTLSNYVLGGAGGASVLLTLFVIYASVSKLCSRPIPLFLRQLLATLLIYALGALLLGLNAYLTQSPTIARWLAPGSFGVALTALAVTNLGSLGTFLAGMIALYLALLLYGIPSLNRLILTPFAWFANKITGRQQKKADDTELPPEPEDGGAPNISSYEGDNYFEGLEEGIDKPPLMIIAGEDKAPPKPKPAKQLKIDFKEDNGGPLDEGVLQDPTFNLEDGDDKYGIKAGVFPPPIEIFGREEAREGEMDEEKALPIGNKIVEALQQFNIDSTLAEILVGPTVVQFRIQLAPGIKVNKVAALANDIALALAVPSLRIEAPIPGKPYVGIEIPNPKRRGIPLRTVIESSAYQDSDAALPLPFGIAVNGDATVIAFEELPHMLVAGTTGSGKSVFVNSCIVGLCSARTPDELRMILVDPKRVEMTMYDKLPHLLTPPVTDAKKAVHVLAWAIREMESRYATFANIRVRNLETYNEKVIPKERLPHIVIVVDELADLMMTAPKEVEEYICRLAQMARATGIHLMLATQRPSVNVITGLIKANIPARVAFTLPSNADSRTIIDCAGAEKLLGKGDMLFLSTRHPKPIRIQSPWVDENVLSGWLNYLTNTFGEPDFIDIDAQSGGGSGEYDSSLFDDDILEDAIDTVISTGIASASGLQRRLRVGFARASRLIDVMEQIGIVGPADGARPREILVDEEGAADILESIKGSGF